MNQLVNIIHDDNRHDRMQVLLKELSEQGITNFRIWDAIRSDTVIKGINLAHKQIIQWAKDNNEPSVIIMEDDVRFTDKGAFDHWQKSKPEYYDIWLGGFYLGVPEDGFLKEFTALHCYEVHSAFYDTILSLPDDIHLDQALAGKGLYLTIEPIVAIQHNGISSNSKQYHNWDIFFTNREFYKNKTA